MPAEAKAIKIYMPDLLRRLEVSCIAETSIAEASIAGGKAFHQITVTSQGLFLRLVAKFIPLRCLENRATVTRPGDPKLARAADSLAFDLLLQVSLADEYSTRKMSLHSSFTGLSLQGRRPCPFVSSPASISGRVTGLTIEAAQKKVHAALFMCFCSPYTHIVLNLKSEFYDAG